MIERIKQFFMEVFDTGTKIIVGFGGAISAATIHTWVGIVAGFLTCVFMAFQIESAWYRRKKERLNIE